MICIYIYLQFTNKPKPSFKKTPCHSSFVLFHRLQGGRRIRTSEVGSAGEVPVVRFHRFDVFFWRWFFFFSPTCNSNVGCLFLFPRKNVILFIYMNKRVYIYIEYIYIYQNVFLSDILDSSWVETQEMSFLS